MLPNTLQVEYLEAKSARTTRMADVKMILNQINEYRRQEKLLDDKIKQSTDDALDLLLPLAQKYIRQQIIIDGEISHMMSYMQPLTKKNIQLWHREDGEGTVLQIGIYDEYDREFDPQFELNADILFNEQYQYQREEQVKSVIQERKTQQENDQQMQEIYEREQLAKLKEKYENE